MLFLLWEMLTNNDREKDATAKDIIMIGMMVDFLQRSSLDIMKISLAVLIVGGAEMLTDMKINHQNVMLGIMVSNPLNNKMFRE